MIPCPSTTPRPGEWQLLWRDPWLLALTVWLPPLLFVLIAALFAEGVARDLAIGVVDGDRSRLARQLIRQYDASPTLRVTAVYPSLDEGLRAMRGGGIYGLIVIPGDLEKEVMLARSPQVEAYYNSQFLLIGRLVKAAILQVHGTAAATVAARRQLAAGLPVVDQAMAAVLPLGSQATPLYNRTSSYAQFLVTAIIPTIWQICIVAASLLALAAELRRGGLAVWLGARPLSALVGKLLPYTLLFWLQGLLFLAAFYGLAGWPMAGSLPMIALCQLPTVLACQAAACFFFFLTGDATRGLSLAAAYTAPSFAYMGVTFPATDMNPLAQLWRSCLPISHFMEIQIGQASYGAPLVDALPQLISLLGFLVLFAVSLLLARRFTCPAPEVTT